MDASRIPPILDPNSVVFGSRFTLLQSLPYLIIDIIHCNVRLLSPWKNPPLRPENNKEVFKFERIAVDTPRKYNIEDLTFRIVKSHA